MQMIEKNGRQIAVVERETKVQSPQDALDLMATAQYEGSSNAIIIYKESLSEDFFDLKSRFAGEVLQKFSNYRVRLAIVGDFKMYKSKALRDFIYECNHGGLVYWVGSLQEALAALMPGD